jgi:hypothetical protein
MIGRCTRGCAAVAALVILILTAMVGPADAEWLDGKHRELCSQHGGVHMVMNGVPITANVQTCTADCFRYTLICRKDKKLVLTSRYSPYAGDSDIFFAEGGAGTVVKFLMILALGGFAAISIFGMNKDREDDDIFIIQNICVVAVFALVVWIWGVRATAAGFSLSELADFFLAPIVLYGVVPIFVAIRFLSFIRGWNYLFVQHPAASLVSPGAAANINRLATTLAAGAEDPGRAGTYHYEHQTEKARSLTADLERQAELMEARAERDRRRAELLEAERLLEEARRRSKGSK